MTEKCRELDAWIAVNLFGMRFEPIDNSNYIGCFVDSYIKQMGKPVKYGDKICVGSFLDFPDKTVEHYSPRFTTDKSAAMEVLEKCATRVEEKFECALQIYPSGDWWRIEPELYMTDCQESAETLPLAIAKFAKKLFESKEGKQ